MHDRMHQELNDGGVTQGVLLQHRLQHLQSDPQQRKLAGTRSAF